MALNEQDIKVLEEVVALDGNCLEPKRCEKCPFRSMCLPEFLHPNPPTKNQRRNMAYDVLTHNALIDDDITRENIKDNYKWPTSKK